MGWGRRNLNKTLFYTCTDTGKLVQWVNRPDTGDQGQVITKKDDKYPTAMLIKKDILFVGFNDGLISVFNTETFR